MVYNNAEIIVYNFAMAEKRDEIEQLFLYAFMKTRGHSNPELPGPQIGTTFVFSLINIMLWLD
jgi:hypothetical protein